MLSHDARVPLRVTLRTKGQPGRFSHEEEPMNDKLLASIEREVLSWPGVSKETGGGSFSGPTSHRLQIWAASDRARPPRRRGRFPVP